MNNNVKLTAHHPEHQKLVCKSEAYRVALAVKAFEDLAVQFESIAAQNGYQCSEARALAAKAVTDFLNSTTK